MPIQIEILIKAANDASFNNAVGRATQAFWLSPWIEINSLIGDKLKEPGKTRPYSISPILFDEYNRNVIKQNDQARIVLSIFDGYRLFKQDNSSQHRNTIVPKISPGLEEVTELSWIPFILKKYHERTIQIANLELELLEVKIKKKMSFESMLNSSMISDYKKWKINFITPTSFKPYTDILYPLPDPEKMLAHLLNQWQSWAPKNMRFEGWIKELFHLNQISRVENLNTDVHKYNQQIEMGFTGSIEMQISKHFPKEYRYVIDTLMKFASFTGFGIHTTRGMGFCNIEER